MKLGKCNVAAGKKCTNAGSCATCNTKILDDQLRRIFEKGLAGRELLDNIVSLDVTCCWEAVVWRCCMLDFLFGGPFKNYVQHALDSGEENHILAAAGFTRLETLLWETYNYAIERGVEPWQPCISHYVACVEKRRNSNGYLDIKCLLSYQEFKYTHAQTALTLERAGGL